MQVLLRQLHGNRDRWLKATLQKIAGDVAAVDVGALPRDRERQACVRACVCCEAARHVCVCVTVCVARHVCVCDCVCVWHVCVCDCVCVCRPWPPQRRA